MNNEYEILFTNKNQILLDDINKKGNHIIVIAKKNLTKKVKMSCRLNELFTLLKHSTNKIETVLFLSEKDDFIKKDLLEEIKKTLFGENKERISLLIPYITPPISDQRIDGEVISFIAPLETIINLRPFSSLTEFYNIAYEVINNHLNSKESNNINIIQVSKPLRKETEFNRQTNKNNLRNASVLIPHKGSLHYLKRCLKHLEQNENAPKNVNICFDDYSWKKFNIAEFPRLKDFNLIYRNIPNPVGPFIARDLLIKKTKTQFIFHMDSDDISTNARFQKQLDEMERRNLDMIGSHELRINQFKKRLEIIRFPLDVNFALNLYSFHPLLHSTSLIKRSAYLKTGGYSTNGKFGFDSQFLLRAHFYLKIGNIDDFVYLRYVRPHSLTTSKKTKFGSRIRNFYAWRWKVDFKLVCEGKLPLENSSLAVVSHTFRHRMEKVTWSPQ